MLSMPAVAAISYCSFSSDRSPSSLEEPSSSTSSNKPPKPIV
jgi:hypothetical protein